MLKLILLSLLMLMISLNLTAQLLVTHDGIEEDEITLSDLYNCTVHNFGGKPLNASICVELRDSSNTALYISEAKRFKIITAETKINRLLHKTLFKDSISCKTRQKLKGSQTLDIPDGSYYLIYRVSESGIQDNDSVITEEFLFLMSHKFVKDSLLGSVNSHLPEVKKAKPIKIGGSIYVDHLSSVRPGDNSFSPINYTNVQITPKIDVLGLPLAGNFLVSSLDFDKGDKVSFGGLSVDTELLKRRLESKAKDVARDSLERFEKKYVQDLDSLIQKYEALDRILSTPDLYKDICADSLGFIEACISDSIACRSERIDTLNLQEDSLQKSIDSLNSLRDKVRTYERLLKEKDQVGSLLKNLKRNFFLNNDTLDLDTSIQDTIDIEKYKKLKEDCELFLKEAKDSVNNIGGEMNSGRLKSLFGTVDKLEIGMFYPQLHELLGRGIGVTGVNVGFKADRYFYSAFTGKVKMPSSFGESYPLGIEMGVGRRDSSHVKLNYIYSTPLLARNKGEKNKVISLSFKKLFLKGLLSLNGIVSGSHRENTDRFAVSAIEGKSTEQGNWIADLLGKRNFTDYAGDFGVGTFLFKRKTELGFRLKRIGEDYYSSLSPFMLRGNYSLEYSLNQKLVKDQIIFKGKYIDTKGLKNGESMFPSAQRQFLAQTSFRFKRFPTVNITYSKLERKISESLAMSVNLYSIQSNFTKRILNLNQVFNVMGTYQLFKVGTMENGFYTVQVSDLMMISKKTNVVMSYHLNGRNNAHEGTVNMHNYNLSMNKQINEKMAVGLGGIYSHGDSRRYGGNISFSYTYKKAKAMINYNSLQFDAGNSELTNGNHTNNFLEHNIRAGIIYNL